MTQRIYLDHAATTPLLPAARAAMAQGFDIWANPSSPHGEGRAAKALLEDARGRIGAALGWDGALLFTSGASEALAIALTRSKAADALAGATEHDAVLRHVPPERRLPVEASGIVQLPDAIPPGALLAIQQVNSETGVIQPLDDLAERIHAAGALLLADCSQGAGKLPLPASADLIVVSAHKLGGPVGIGALLVRDLALLSPSGGQEQGYRAGTEAMPLALGFAAALEEPRDWLADAARWRAQLDEAIVAMGGELVAADAPRLPTIAGYRMPGLSAQAQLIRFDMAGIAVSAGSACSSGTLKASGVLTAMGWDAAHAGEVVRVSLGHSGSQNEIHAFLAQWAGPIFGDADMIYLDYQATTVLAPEVATAMTSAMAHYGNPNSAHRIGRIAAADVELARDRVRASLGKSDGTLVFTSGATEALNIAIVGAARAAPPGRKRVVTIATEHAAVLQTVMSLRHYGYEPVILPVGPDGLVDLDIAEAAIDERAALLAVMQVNNEIGVMQPLGALLALARDAGVPVLCDAVQGFGKFETPASDMIAITAHKMHGPKGIGALWLREGLELPPLMQGSSQESGLRPGTLSPMLCAGFGVAADLAMARRETDLAHVEQLWSRALSAFDGWTSQRIARRALSWQSQSAPRGPRRRPAALLAAPCRHLAGLGLRQRHRQAQPCAARARPHGRRGALFLPAELRALYRDRRDRECRRRDQRGGAVPESRGMIRVRFVSADGSQVQDVDARDGDNLLDVAQAAGQPLEGTCEGQMACSTCHVILDPADFARLPKASEDEEDMLDLAASTTRFSRLSLPDHAHRRAGRTDGEDPRRKPEHAGRLGPDSISQYHSVPPPAQAGAHAHMNDRAQQRASADGPSWTPACAGERPNGGDPAICSAPLFVQRLPELDLVAFRVHDPGEAAAGIAVVALERLDALRLDPRQERVEIVHGIVDHMVARRRREICGVGREGAPDERGWMAGRIGLYHRATPVLQREAEHVAIPGREGLGVFRLEEDAADAGNPPLGRLVGGGGRAVRRS